MRLLLTLLLIATIQFAPTRSANAGMVFVEWDATFQGTAPGLTVSNTPTLNLGTLELDDLTATDPTFLGLFPDFIPFLSLEIPAAGLDAALAMTFSTPLATGSELLIFDVDFSDERLFLTSGGTPLTFIGQLETIAGENSMFPTYTAATGELHVNTNSPNNFEATRFDIAGLSSLDISAFRSQTGFNSGLRIAIAVPTQMNAVPEPSSAILLGGMFGLAGLLQKWRRRREGAI